MSIKIKQLIEKLREKDPEADVEFVVVETTGEGNLVCMDIEANAHQMAELLTMFKPSFNDERALHWSDVLDVALDANRDKVKRKYHQLSDRYSRNSSTANQAKFDKVQKAWKEYKS